MIFFFHWMALRIVCVVTCTFLTFFPALHEPTPNGVRVIHKIDGMCDRPVPWRSQARKKDKKNSDPYRIKESFRFALSLSVCLSILARSFLVQTPRMLVSGEQLHFVFFFSSHLSLSIVLFLTRSSRIKSKNSLKMFSVWVHCTRAAAAVWKMQYGSDEAVFIIVM